MYAATATPPEAHSPSTLAAPAQQKPTPLGRLGETLQASHYSPRTETYCHRVERFISFQHDRHPCEMGRHEINVPLSDQAAQKKVSASMHGQAHSALTRLAESIYAGCINQVT